METLGLPRFPWDSPGMATMCRAFLGVQALKWFFLIFAKGQALVRLKQDNTDDRITLRVSKLGMVVPGAQILSDCSTGTVFVSPRGLTGLRQSNIIKREAVL